MSNQDAPKVHESGAFRVHGIRNGLFKENTYLIEDRTARLGLLLDPGEDFGTITDLISTLGITLDGIYLTHGHFDHIASAEKIALQFNLPVRAHPNERKLIRRAPFYAIKFAKSNFKALTQVQFVELNKPYFFGTHRIEFIETPGHTSGSMAIAVDKCVFTGDTLFYRHIGPTNYPESSPELIRESVGKILSKCADDTTIFPGHGRTWVVKEAKEWWSDIGINPPSYQIDFKTGVVGEQ